MNDKKNDSDDIDQSSAPLIEHLAELRNRLIKSVVAFFEAILVEEQSPKFFGENV